MSGRGRGRGRGRGGRVSVSKELLKRSAAEAGLDDRHLKVLTDITQPPLYPAFLWHSAGGYFEPPEPSTTRELAERAIAAAGAEDSNHPSESQPAAAAAAAPALSRIRRTTGTVYIMNKQRELADRFAASAHSVPPTAPQDVVRYRVPPRGAPDAAVLQQLSSFNRKLAADERYFPAELLYSSAKISGKKSKVATTTSAVDEIPAGEKLLEPVSSDTLPVDPAALLTKVKREEGVDKGSDEEDDEDDPPEISAEVDVEEEGADYTANYYASDDDESAGDDGDGGEATF